ncbi:Golgi-associated plant pathogenesis-related protein 1-like [Dendronephthya gigantea]|uniref:Golgi-associated plant pathogenesis-related protein 1-like n=1 Tax=Dendronephthya gigantea TaxID=151771 RepID=UPI00106BA798|nr:Golgi-associated plant pathogenesis-related protein 1-like [Dendronephthya gigantea]
MNVFSVIANCILFILLLALRLAVNASSAEESWKNIGSCGQGLACNPQCQLACLKMHNYYRSLHNSPPLHCDSELAKSAQRWTDQQAKTRTMHHSQWTDKYTENISWKGGDWPGMNQVETAVKGAVRSWYSEIKNDYNYQTGKSNDRKTVGHFQAVVWKNTQKIGCGINIIPGHGTYVTVHYYPASHAHMNYFELAVGQVMPKKEPASKCRARSSEREPCDKNLQRLQAPYVVPDECLKKGCCYDDVFLSEPSVSHYDREGREWCFKPSK